MPKDSTGWTSMAPGIRMLESIPNVSENQKKQIEDLTKKNMDEIKKLREEMFSKMQGIRDSQRKEVLNVLTDEQKKFLESRGNRLNALPEKAK
jgi:gas vesicle protein